MVYVWGVLTAGCLVASVATGRWDWRLAWGVCAVVFGLAMWIATFSTYEPSGPAADRPGIPVLSDPRSTYWPVEASKHSDGIVVILTRRDGPSGTSYSRRECDCRGRFRYLGDGDTIEVAKRGIKDKSMTVLSSGSISDYVCAYACR